MRSKEYIEKNWIFIFISIFTLIYTFLIAYNISPYLRGPNDIFLESHTPFYFINTFSKIWAPIAAFLMICLIYIKAQHDLKSRKREIGYLILLVIFIFIFQISLVYFSRFGTTVLFQRLVHPGMNGYFSTVVKTRDANWFMGDFNDRVDTFDQHARDHPPGSLLLIKGVIISFENNKKITHSISSFIRPPSKPEATFLWNNLNESQRVSSIFLAFLFHFLGALVIIPIYYFAKQIGGSTVGIRAAFLYGLMPSVVFFALKFDPFYAIFPVTSCLLLMLGIDRKNINLMVTSGVIFGLGLFFSFSIFPVLAIMLVFLFIKFIQKKDSFLIKLPFYFILGLLIVIGILYIFNFNFVSAFPHIIGGQAPRMYFPWLVYNPYDFFVYIGVPASLLFIIYSYKTIIKKRTKDNKSFLLYSFWIVFITLIVSGISRGEVGRIWLPLMFLPIALISAYITDKLKISNKQFVFLMVLLFIQIIVMEEFWVPIW